MALTTLSDLKAHLGISADDTSEDTYLTATLLAVEKSLKRIIGYEIEANSNVTEYYDGDGRNKLFLRQLPVRSIVSVKVDNNGGGGQIANTFGSETLLVAGTEYYLPMDGPLGAYSESGTLYRRSYYWPGQPMHRRGLLTNEIIPGNGNIQVVYNSGYTTVPADIKETVWQSVAQLRMSRDKGMPISSESFDGYSYSLNGAVDAAVMQVASALNVIATYRRFRI